MKDSRLWLQPSNRWVEAIWKCGNSTRTWQHSLSATRTSYEAWSSKDCVAYAFNLFYNQFISNIVNTHPNASTPSFSQTVYYNPDKLTNLTLSQITSSCN